MTDPLHRDWRSLLYRASEQPKPMDMSRVQAVLGSDLYQQVLNSTLPKIETMALLEIWEQGSRKKLRTLVADGSLLPILMRLHRSSLERANELRGSAMNLTPAECLQEAGLPMIL